MQKSTSSWDTSLQVTVTPATMTDSVAIGTAIGTATTNGAVTVIAMLTIRSRVDLVRTILRLLIRLKKSVAIVAVKGLLETGIHIYKSISGLNTEQQASAQQSGYRQARDDDAIVATVTAIVTAAEIFSQDMFGIIRHIEKFKYKLCHQYHHLWTSWKCTGKKHPLTKDTYLQRHPISFLTSS
ncbi:hypothetical protein EJ04DRAFT_152162 [Polyplosphaeria fusca]|uniref:Uncharacterized protein n=1 Tax=Polyplosphaeria fusca TaxID=682080 RepID=A0A9P4QJT9_9PLEO|nr:hypothetical protein EJ04DRAFT_152162 [Polyplosphaeria fusca]